MSLSTLSGAATGEVSFCCFCHVSALLKDVAQTLRVIQVRICNIGESKAVSLKIDAASFSFVMQLRFISDSPAGTQWKPTVTVVVLTDMQPGRQRSTGSTE